MEKKSKQLAESIPPVKLHSVDIKELYEILYSANNDVKLETKDHMFNSIDELFSSNLDKINCFKMAIKDPYISLDFSESRIFLYSANDDFRSQGIYISIKNFLISRKRKVSILIQHSILLSLLTGIALGSNVLYTRNIPLGITATILSVIMILTGIQTYKSTHTWYTIIYLKTDAANSSFLKRKKDDILLMVISSLLGAIIGAAITYLFMILNK